DRAQVAEGVEQLQLVGGFEQRLVLALAVDVHEDVADLLEGGDGDGLIVDVAVTAAGPVQAPGQDDLAVFQGRADDLLDLLAQVGVDQVEAAGDAQLVGPGAQQLGRTALAQQQAQRSKEKRLAGAGLAGPGAEAGLQLDADVLDEGQVLHSQFAEHAGI